MSDSVQPHRRQPTRLPCPWDSPGKNTGAGCHFLLQCMKVKSESEVAQSCSTPSDPIDCSRPGSSIQGIFQTRILEWGAIAFSNKCAIRKKIIQPKSYSFPFCFHRIHSLLGLVLSYLKSVRSSGLRKTAKIRETKLSRQAVKPRRF